MGHDIKYLIHTNTPHTQQMARADPGGAKGTMPHPKTCFRGPKRPCLQPPRTQYLITAHIELQMRSNLMQYCTVHSTINPVHTQCHRFKFTFNVLILGNTGNIAYNVLCTMSTTLSAVSLLLAIHSKIVCWWQITYRLARS